jgi:hypothetical protein
VNAHLWEFPNVEVAPGDSDVMGAARKVLGVRPARLELLATIKHSITRYRITLEAYRVIPATVWKRTVPALTPPLTPALSRRERGNRWQRRVQSKSALGNSTRREARIGGARGRWLGRSGLDQLAFTSAHKRILEQLGA